MSTQSINLLLKGCRRRSQLQSHAGLRQRRPRVIRKSRRFLINSNSCVQEDQSVQVDAVLCETPETVVMKVEESIDLELIDLMSSNSADTRHEVGTSTSETENSEKKKPSEFLCTEKNRQVFLIEGNKAYVVDAKPWPKKVRESVTGDFKKPNPKLTPAELKRQAKTVAKRRELVEELSREKRRLRYQSYLNGIYCLPRSLITESSARLLSWYQPPYEEKNDQSAQEAGEGK